jgi:AcrR family transcriptional regulator
MNADTDRSTPLRRDAARNRDRLVRGAHEVFARDGIDASLADVAQAAGVGVATLYRRFPTKQSLIDAVVYDLLVAIIALAEDAATQPGGRGLETFLPTYAAHLADHRACLSELWISDHELVNIAWQRITALLTDAHVHAAVRDDLTKHDLLILLWSIRAVVEGTAGISPEAWQLPLKLLVDGIQTRPSAAPDNRMSADCR